MREILISHHLSMIGGFACIMMYFNIHINQGSKPNLNLFEWKDQNNSNAIDNNNNNNALLIAERIHHQVPISPAAVKADKVLETALAVKDRSNKIASTLAREFPIWNASLTPYNWCTPDYLVNRKVTKPIPPTGAEGILFAKIPKCASTTGMGVTLRVSDMLGRRMYMSNNTVNTNIGIQIRDIHNITNDPRWKKRHREVVCNFQARHNFLYQKKFEVRNKEKSFLWTMIREPAQRALSNAFWRATKHDRKRNVTEAMILNSLRHTNNFMFGHLKVKQTNNSYYKNTNQKPPDVNHVGNIIHHFDFIALAERMPESLVAFSMLARVPLADVIVLSSKQSGNDKRGADCRKPEAKWTTPAIDRYLSNMFVTKNQLDYMMYNAVNKSLDLTIDALGRELVQNRLKKVHLLMEKNDGVCYDKALSRCARNRNQQEAKPEHLCYYSDSGCGYKCTDYVLKQESDTEWEYLTSLLNNTY